MDKMDGYTLLSRIRAKLPHLPVVLMTAYGTIEKAVECMKAGAVHYMVKPFEMNELIGVVQKYYSKDASDVDDFVAVDEKTKEAKILAEKVAKSQASVMILGESGTGKEVLSRFIHRVSNRAEGPFVAINCAAIPDNMLEAILFGYEKGAFTGAAKTTPGKFELAQGGTILLDEISEMPLDLQTKLLRVLQEREVERLGAIKPIELDVRVLATSNREMKKEVAQGRFREDLYYRLNVFPLHMPPLRERKGDILPVAKRLLARHCKGVRPQPELSEEAANKLLSHGWPGNIRELDNVIQRSLILMQGEVIEADAILLESDL
jgi:two-component system response regulator FlrC